MAVLKRCPWFIPVIIVSVLSAGHPVPCRGQGNAGLVAEPGFLAEDGTWVLPFSLPVDPAAPDIEDAGLTVSRAGRPLVIREQFAYPLQGTGGPATALVVLLDLPPLETGVQAAWTVDLATLLERTATPGVRASLVRCGAEAPQVPRPGEVVVSPQVVADLLAAPQSSRLWDGVIAAITALTSDDLPERRVLLLVSDGREEIPSRHVMASCIDAALRARVAVYVVSLADGTQAEADAARLQELARRTGGQMLSGERPLVPELANVLARIGAARGLRLEADTMTLPVEITIRWNGETGPPIVGEIARRQALGRSGSGRWLIVMGALLAAAAAGYLLWRQRTVMMGDLMIRTRNGVRRFPVPRHGVTIGRDRDNSMVLNNRLVSRHHAVIRVNDGSVIITDLRSTRGTTVNGEPIGTRNLVSGDRIVIGGSVELVFKDRMSTSEM